jgi:hypothetical protein
MFEKVYNTHVLNFLKNKLKTFTVILWQQSDFNLHCLVRKNIENYEIFHLSVTVIDIL